jgi:hypothetical protein
VGQAIVFCRLFFAEAALRDHAKITSHLPAGQCGARTLACRVDTPVDARCSGAKKRREESNLDAARRNARATVSHAKLFLRSS